MCISNRHPPISPKCIIALIPLPCHQPLQALIHYVHFIYQLWILLNEGFLSQEETFMLLRPINTDFILATNSRTCLKIFSPMQKLIIKNNITYMYHVMLLLEQDFLLANNGYCHEEEKALSWVILVR